MIEPADDVVPLVKGDRVETLIDTGGASRTYEGVATRAGRPVEVRTGRGLTIRHQ